MTRNARIVLVSIGSLLAMALGLAPVVRAADPVPASNDWYFRVYKVNGDNAKWGKVGLKAAAPDGWHPLKVGDRIPSGNQVNTGMRTTVELVMVPANPPTIILIKPLTLASVDEVFKGDAAAVARLGLAYGAIRAGVAEGELRSDLQIRSPVATLSKRGTWGFEIFVERGTGRFEISLSDRGLVEAIQNATGQRRLVLPGQFVNQIMSRWIEQVRFTRNVSVQDLFGLTGADAIFNLDNGSGLGVLLPGGNQGSILNHLGQTGLGNGNKLSLGDLFNNQNGGNGGNGTQNLRLFQVLRDRVNNMNSGPTRGSEGDFGVGFGSVPFLNSNQAKSGRRH